MRRPKAAPAALLSPVMQRRRRARTLYSTLLGVKYGSPNRSDAGPPKKRTPLLSLLLPAALVADLVFVGVLAEFFLEGGGKVA